VNEHCILRKAFLDKRSTFWRFAGAKVGIFLRTAKHLDRYFVVRVKKQQKSDKKRLKSDKENAQKTAYRRKRDVPKKGAAGLSKPRNQTVEPEPPCTG